LSVSVLKTSLVWLMFPLTVVEGIWLKFRARRLPGAEGHRRGTCGLGAPLHLLAVGDSIIDGVGTPNMESALPVLFADALSRHRDRQVRWRVEGMSGRDIAGLIRSLDCVDEKRVDVILISIGVNDVTGLTSTRRWRGRVHRLLDRLHAMWPDAEILFAGLPPMARFPLLPQPLRFTLGWRADTLDAIAAGICHERPGVHHVPTVIDPERHTFSEDGYHPSSDSCADWANVLVKFTGA
jgi:hypothetical protein